MRIGTDFPGGNVAVRSLEEKRALLSPELRDTEGYWFYWCFEAGFDVPGDYEFEFDGIAVGACGPAVSEDGGPFMALARFRRLYGLPLRLPR